LAHFLRVSIHIINAKVLYAASDNKVVVVRKKD